MSSLDFHRKLLAREVYVLPGTFFFWNKRHLGNDFVRVALARDPRMFQAAARQLALEIQRYVG